MTDDGRAAVAAAPGHVTGFFSVHRDPDPRVAGSRGAGLTLTDEVRVRVEPVGAGGEGVWLDGRRADVAPVRDVLGAFDGRAAVRIESDLPVGAGFGVSGAAALGTALAANAAFDAGRSENDLVGLAHRAEVEAGTGLGDVVAQARGRAPIRLEPGAPGHGLLDGIPVCSERRVEYVSFGEVSTGEVVGGETDRLTRAGEAALDRLRERPTLDRFVDLSRRFAEEAGLLTERAGDAIADAEAAGGTAAMAMLGDTAFAVGTALSDAGYEPSVCSIHPCGATLVEDGGAGRQDDEAGVGDDRSESG
ncbi:MAG: pantoate kinase [Haloferacaceae archaeon]